MPLCRSPLTLRLALFSRSRTAAVEIPRFILHRRRSEFLPLHRGAKNRSANARCDPCTVGFRAPPVADTARKASRCRPQVRERIAEARAANGEGAKIRAQYASAAPPLQNVPARRAHLNFAPKGVQNITRGFAADITAPRARYNFSPQAKNITEIRRLAAVFH